MEILLMICWNIPIYLSSYGYQVKENVRNARLVRQHTVELLYIF